MKRCIRFAPPLAAALLAACAGAPPAPEPAPRPDVDATLEEEYTPARDGTPEERLQEALAFVRNDQIGAAEQALTALAAEFPEHSGALTNLGILQSRNGRHSEAIISLTEAARRNTRNTVAMNWLAHCYRSTRQPERAERVWLDALRVDPNYTAAHINLGLLYEDVLADAESAIRHYRAAWDTSGGEELRVLPWIAQLEARLQRGETERAALSEQ